MFTRWSRSQKMLGKHALASLQYGIPIFRVTAARLPFTALALVILVVENAPIFTAYSYTRNT